MVSQITAEELRDKIDSGDEVLLIDTRPSDSFESWHIEGAVNVPYHPHKGLEAKEIDRVKDLSGNGHVTTICGKGLTSTPFAFELEDNGISDVTIVKGGMEDWSKIYHSVPIVTGDELIIRQIQRRAKGCLGYIVGSSKTGEAAVFDATRQIDSFKIAAEDAGLTIEKVFDTHVHADHISGGYSLANELGKPYYLGEKSIERGVEYNFDAVSNGDEFQIGDIEIEAIYTPGHTSDMVNYLIDNEYLLTGDTLFVESVGRTELQYGDEQASIGAEMLHETLHKKILSLPGKTKILPGHISVSSNGVYGVGSPGEPVMETLSELERSLELLGLEEQDFIDRLAKNTPEKPPNYEEVISINKGLLKPDTEEQATELELGPNNCAA